MIAAFLAETGWHPTMVRPMAGAPMYTKYNWLIRMIMKRIAHRAGASTDTSRDHTFTKWQDLDDLIGKLADKLRSSQRLENRAESADRTL
jgi:menaquinone-dependent protoporphyrinogen oxidase